MASVNEINLNDLRTLIDSIFDHLSNDLGIERLALEHDYYNTVPLQHMIVDPGSDAEVDVVMGQLYDDLEFLRPLLQDKSGCTSLMFDHVAPLLRYIALRVGQ